jgi:hypothetical protein
MPPAWTVHDSATCCGLSTLLSLINRSPLEEPGGIHFTFMVQEFPALTLGGQSFVCEYALDAVTLMLLMVRDVVPVFVKATARAGGGQE